MCTGRQHPLEKKVIPQVLTHKFATGMTLGLIAKDVSIATKFRTNRSDDFRSPTAFAKSGKTAEASIGANADQTEVARLWEKAKRNPALKRDSASREDTMTRSILRRRDFLTLTGGAFVAAATGCAEAKGA